MKLWNDFGVRALLATLCCCGFYAVMLLMIGQHWPVNDIVTVGGLSLGPVGTAIAFYFSSRSQG